MLLFPSNYYYQIVGTSTKYSVLTESSRKSFQVATPASIIGTLTAFTAISSFYFQHCSYVTYLRPVKCSIVGDNECIVRGCQRFWTEWMKKHEFRRGNGRKRQRKRVSCSNRMRKVKTLNQCQSQYIANCWNVYATSNRWKKHEGKLKRRLCTIGQKRMCDFFPLWEKSFYRGKKEIFKFCIGLCEFFNDLPAWKVPYSSWPMFSVMVLFFVAINGGSISVCSITEWRWVHCFECVWMYVCSIHLLKWIDVFVCKCVNVYVILFDFWGVESVCVCVLGMFFFVFGFSKSVE